MLPQPTKARPFAPLVVVAAVALCTAGCSFTIPYPLKPSPRIQVVDDRLVKDGQTHEVSAIGDLVAGNPAAEREAYAYKVANTSATVLDTLGLVTDLAGLGGVIGGASVHDHTALDVGLLLAIMGADFLLFGNLASRDARRHATNAANIYNDGLPPEAFAPRPAWSVPSLPTVTAPAEPAPPAP